MIILKLIFGFIYKILKQSYYESSLFINQKKYPKCKIDKTVKLGHVEIEGNIIINKNSYMNSGQLVTGKKSKIRYDGIKKPFIELEKQSLYGFIPNLNQDSKEDINKSYKNSVSESINI